jgi:HAAS domain-containing protein
MIDAYLQSLTRELDFDRSLSRRVRQEVEDHLSQAVAADTAGDLLEAQRSAIANFGDARAIAAQFAVISLARRARTAGVEALVAVGCVFMAMKARVAWYAAVQWTGSADTMAVRALLFLIDRYAFWMAIVIALGCWFYIRSRAIPPAFDPGFRRQLRRFLLLFGAAALALVVSVLSDAALTALSLRGNQWSAGWLVPIVSIAVEVACVGILVFQIRRIMLRAASTAAMMKA